MIVSLSGDDTDLLKSLSSGAVRQSDELFNEPAGDGDMSVVFNVAQNKMCKKEKKKNYENEISSNNQALLLGKISLHNNFRRFFK